MTQSSEELSKAKVNAFRLLKIRQRSVGEMRSKLAAKGISKATVDETVAFLLDKKFLDDRAFTKAWIRYRQARPYGPQRIRLELRQKGIADDILQEELGEAFGTFAEEDVVLELARRRAARYKALDPVKRKKRVFDFLARRGFGLDAINKAVKKL